MSRPEAAAVVARFRVPEDHPALPGHFPGRPIVPGVLLLDAVLQALRDAGAGLPTRLLRAKFAAPVMPGLDGSPKVAQLFDFATMAADNDSTVDGDHGMACAAAATGTADDGEGQAGVAGGCRVLGIRRGGDEVRYSEMYLWLAGLDADSVTAGFPAQLADGADVITNSIALGPSIGSPISALMQDTFDAVTDQGRG